VTPSPSSRRSGGPVRFLKVEGAGNDFVLIDGRRGPAPRLSRSRIRALLDRHRGIGGDGLLLLELAATPERTQVRYWNADGGRADFCGNGARCVALRLLSEAPGDGEVRFRLGRVAVRARRAPAGRIAVLHPVPRELALPARPPEGPRGIRPVWINSGVPHWILPVPRVDDFNLERWGPALRVSPRLGRAGTNVDAVEIRAGQVHVRTWERGVEGETQACGSGILAAAFWAWRRAGIPPPIRLRSRGGDRFRMMPGGQDPGLWVEGPAKIVFGGTLNPGSPGNSRNP
jgi:diaminopimelate epimerase